MKKLLIIASLLIVSNLAFSQRNYYYKSYEKAWTVQIAPTVIDYDGSKYGFAVGANFRERLSLNYFRTSDLKRREGSWMYTYYSGFQAAMVFPLVEGVEVGGGLRIAAVNTEWQKPLWTNEVRVKVSDGLRLAYEYGKNNGQKASAIKLIWNLY